MEEPEAEDSPESDVGMCLCPQIVVTKIVMFYVLMYCLSINFLYTALASASVTTAAATFGFCLTISL